MNSIEFDHDPGVFEHWLAVGLRSWSVVLYRNMKLLLLFHKVNSLESLVKLVRKKLLDKQTANYTYTIIQKLSILKYLEITTSWINFLKRSTIQNSEKMKFFSICTYISRYLKSSITYLFVQGWSLLEVAGLLLNVLLEAVGY